MQVHAGVPPLRIMAKLFQKIERPVAPKNLEVQLYRICFSTNLEGIQEQRIGELTTFGTSWSWTRGPSTASFGEEPKSSTLHKICSTPDMMRDPPAPPVAR
jgi:hypothetical protein